MRQGESEEFENFDRTMRDLMKVPHEDIKAELEAEKVSKRDKPKRKRKANDDRAKNADSAI